MSNPLDIWPPISQPASLPPSGPAGGDLSGTYPNPTVVGLKESGGTDMPIGAIADGQLLKRSGATIVGVTPPTAVSMWSPYVINPATVNALDYHGESNIATCGAVEWDPGGVLDAPVYDSGNKSIKLKMALQNPGTLKRAGIRWAAPASEYAFIIRCGMRKDFGDLIRWGMMLLQGTGTTDDNIDQFAYYFVDGAGGFSKGLGVFRNNDYQSYTTALKDYQLHLPATILPLMRVRVNGLNVAFDFCDDSNGIDWFQTYSGVSPFAITDAGIYIQCSATNKTPALYVKDVWWFTGAGSSNPDTCRIGGELLNL